MEHIKRILLGFALAFFCFLPASALPLTAPENCIWEIFSTGYDAAAIEVTSIHDRSAAFTLAYDPGTGRGSSRGSLGSGGANPYAANAPSRSFPPPGANGAFFPAGGAANSGRACDPLAAYGNALLRNAGRAIGKAALEGVMKGAGLVSGAAAAELFAGAEGAAAASAEGEAADGGEPFLYHGTTDAFANNITTNGLDADALNTASRSANPQGLYLSPYTTSAEDYANLKSLENPGSSPAILKIPMSTVAPYIRAVSGANGEIEYIIDPENFSNIPASAFTLHP